MKFEATEIEAFTKRPAMILTSGKTYIVKDENGYTLCVGTPSGNDSETIEGPMRTIAELFSPQDFSFDAIRCRENHSTKTIDVTGDRYHDLSVYPDHTIIIERRNGVQWKWLIKNGKPIRVYPPETPCALGGTW